MRTICNYEIFYVFTNVFTRMQNCSLRYEGM